MSISQGFFCVQRLAKKEGRKVNFEVFWAISPCPMVQIWCANSKKCIFLALWIQWWSWFSIWRALEDVGSRRCATPRALHIGQFTCSKTVQCYTKNPKMSKVPKILSKLVYDLLMKYVKHGNRPQQGYPVFLSPLAHLGFQALTLILWILTLLFGFFGNKTFPSSSICHCLF